jgi:hypothetical protein
MEFENLGNSCDYTENDAIKRDMLTLHELGELIRRLGLELKLRPVVEHPVPSEETVKGKRYIDWVWKDSKGKVVAAFEIEGANCGKAAVKKDSDSLGNIKCKFKAVLLYQVRKDKHLKLSNKIKEAFEELDEKGITLWKDTELMEDELELFKPFFQVGS